MKFFFLLIGLVLMTSKSKSQGKIFEADFSNEKDLKIVAAGIPTGNNPPFLHLMTASTKNLKHIYVSNSGQKREVQIRTSEEDTVNSFFDESRPERSLITLYRTSRYIFHHVFKDRMIDILYRAPSLKYFFIVTDINNGTFQITDTLKVKPEWDFVDCFVSGEEIILLHSNGIKNKFFITSKKNTEKIRTDILKVEFPEEYEKNNLGDYSETGNPEANMVLPGMNLWLPPYLVNSNKLTMRSGNDLRILINDKKFNTWLISVDLLQHTSQVKKYSCSGYKENYKRAFISSWSTDSILIRGFHWKDSIVLLFDNIYQTGEPQKLIITKDNFDKLVRSDITKTGDFWSKSNIEQSGFREFVKKCSTGRLIITGYENKGMLSLTLSTKYDLITATVLGNIFTLGMMQFSQVNAPSTISFDLTYNLRDKSTGPGPVNNMEWEKMLMFLWANRSFILSWNLNFFDDYYYISYYASHVKKIFVHRFRKQLENN